MTIEADNSASLTKVLFGMTLLKLQDMVVALALPKYRGKQLFEAIYRGRVDSVAAITTLPVEVRERLAAEGVVVGRPQMVQTATVR